jgi:toxin ParE1/3/4
VTEYRLHPAAREEFLAAVDRYNAEAPGVGTRFATEIERCLELLLEQSHIGAPYAPRFRRFVVDDGFPFSLIYAVAGETIFVISVAHHSRRPGFWRRRAAR